MDSALDAPRGKHAIWRRRGLAGGALALLLLGSVGCLVFGTPFGVDRLAPRLYALGQGKLGSWLLNSIARVRPGTELGRNALEERAARDMRSVLGAGYSRQGVTRQVWEDYRRVVQWGDQSAAASYAETASLVFRAAGDGRSAVAILDDALSRGPSEPDLERLLYLRMSALLYSVRGYPEVVETFEGYVAEHPERAAAGLVRLTLAAYARSGRRTEGVARLRGLARANQGSRLADSVRECLSKRVSLYAAAAVGAGGKLTPYGVERAKRVGSGLRSHALAVVSSEADAIATARALGLRGARTDRRLDRPAGAPKALRGLAARGDLRALAPEARRAWEAVRSLGGGIGEGQQVLVVCDARTIALAVMAGTDNWSLAPLGGTELGPCDEVRLCFQEGALARVELGVDNISAPWPNLQTWPRSK